MKSQSTGVWLYVPRIFNAATFPRLANLHDEAHWLLHRIIHLGNTYRHGADEYVNISRQTMETFIKPNDVKAIRETLLDPENAVIECDGIYIRKAKDPKGIGKALGYRLAQPYVGELRRVEVMKPSLAAKILKHRITVNSTPVAETDLEAVHRYLLDWLRKLRIDVDSVYPVIDRIAEENAAKDVAKLGKRNRAKMVKRIIDSAAMSKAACRMTAEQISNGELNFDVCHYGRVHTPVTRLLTEARDCLSINGESLTNLDIANSQLVFFALLLLEHYYSIASEDSHILPNLPYASSAPYHSPLAALPPTAPASPLLPAALSCRPIPLQTPSPRTNNPLLPPDVAEFTTKVEQGSIYEAIMAQGKVDPKDRKAFKQRFFQDVLYGDPTEPYAKQSPVSKAFKATYPNVAAFIETEKRGGYQKLAQKMQARESRYMIGTVCKRLMQYHEHIPVITIHDSIMTTPEHTVTVKRIMVEEFTRIGIGALVR